MLRPVGQDTGWLNIEFVDMTNFGPRSYPLPHDEVGRLAELERYRILDTPEEHVFNQITQLTSRVFDAPIALISLIAARRQWFKAKVGLTACETSRDVAFCTHTVLGEEVLVVPDATLDPRFCDNPLVTGPPHIRFYAGTPLIAPTGHKLGTLCVIDTKPRKQFDSKDKRTLRDLSALVIDQFDLQRVGGERRDQESLLIKQNEELERQRAELQLALDQEKELTSLQRQFVSMVTHELRTPLAVIDGNAHRILRLSDQVTSDKAKNAVTTIRRSVGRLVELMESVLSASRLEAGAVKFDPELCDPTPVIVDTIGSYIELHPDREISVDIERLPKDVTMDVKLMRQVFSNLIANAIKYSPEGGKITVRGEVDAGDKVVFSFVDEGVGIPKDELSQLFQRFFRATTSAGIAGSGIGLHMVKSMVEMHGGDITVTSEAGQGSVFSVRLPQRQSDLASVEGSAVSA
ncbi:MAG: GAF domain-containing sensor histidine kinase [Pseudomonadota bacterium]